MRDTLAKQMGLNPMEGPAILAIVEMLERDNGYVEDMGAVNRWPEPAIANRGLSPAWTASCAEIGSPGHLPVQIRSRLGLG